MRKLTKYSTILQYKYKYDINQKNNKNFQYKKKFLNNRITSIIFQY